MTEQTAPTCMQTVEEGGDCCSSFKGVCTEPAAWEHRDGGVRLCEQHAKNALNFGGPKLGYWFVADTKVSYPDGWTRVADGAPLVIDAPKASPSGLILP